MFVTVTEKWDYWHTTDFRVLLHFFLDKMQEEGKFIRNRINNDRSVYSSDGSPTKIFTSLEAANEYIEYLRPHKPVSTTINTFDTEESLSTFIDSVRDPNRKKTAWGPMPEDYERVRKELGL